MTRGRTTSLLAAALVMAACSHTDAFSPSPEDPRGPRDQGSFVRLTYNSGDDRTPSWLPDGSGVIYSSERLDSPDHDRCLRVMPAAGGAISMSYCDHQYAHQDSTDRFESPAVSESGRLLFLRAVSRIGVHKGPRLHLMLGHLAQPAQSTEITPIPYFASSGITHYYAGYPVWAGPDDFAYLGQYLWYQGSTIFPDTFVTGLEIVRGRVTGEIATLTVVPNTQLASSISLGSSADHVIATFGGDSRVYRVSLTDGSRSMIWDFGTAGIVRDAAVSGTTLVAVVGGSVLFQEEINHGFVQRDEGGYLHIVDLLSGISQILDPPDVLFRRPALAPDGHSVMVEVSPYAPVHVGPNSEYNAANHRPDLWLLTLE